MFKKVLIASALLASVVGANAQSTGFGVIGTIAPATCTVSLSGGGTADYGTMTTAAVQARTVENGAYNLGVKGIGIAVNCTAPVALELAFVDNKAAQRLNFSDTYDTLRYGLGNGSSSSVFGHYDLSLDQVLVDGVTPAVWLSAPTGTTTWATTVAGGAPAFYAQPGRAVGFDKVAGATVPASLTAITGSLVVVARVSKPIVDASTAAITLNGSGTISLQYL